MKIFLDTANLDEIKEAASWGVISGVTTNPSLVAKEGQDFHGLIHTISKIVPGPISAEVTATEAQAMVVEAKELAALAPNVVVKIPMTEQGLKSVSVLKTNDIKTNVTLVFSANQALLAALAGASYVSPFVGRLDDIGNEGLQILNDIVTIYKSYAFSTEVIAASIRHPVHVLSAAQIGADISTVPFGVLKQMFKHPLTDAGIQRFLDDWRKAASQKPR